MTFLTSCKCPKDKTKTLFCGSSCDCRSMCVHFEDHLSSYSVDYDTLRALDSDNTSTTPSMSEEEINSLPVHKYKVPGPASER